MTYWLPLFIFFSISRAQASQAPWIIDDIVIEKVEAGKLVPDVPENTLRQELRITVRTCLRPLRLAGEHQLTLASLFEDDELSHLKRARQARHCPAKVIRSWLPLEEGRPESQAAAFTIADRAGTQVFTVDYDYLSVAGKIVPDSAMGPYTMFQNVKIRKTK